MMTSAPKEPDDPIALELPADWRDLFARYLANAGDVSAPVPGSEQPDIVQQMMLRDIDAILRRLDAGIPEQQKRMDRLLERLANHSA